MNLYVNILYIGTPWSIDTSCNTFIINIQELRFGVVGVCIHISKWACSGWLSSSTSSSGHVSRGKRVVTSRGISNHVLAMYSIRNNVDVSSASSSSSSGDDVVEFTDKVYSRTTSKSWHAIYTCDKMTERDDDDGWEMNECCAQLITVSSSSSSSSSSMTHSRCFMAQLI